MREQNSYLKNFALSFLMNISFYNKRTFIAFSFILLYDNYTIQLTQERKYTMKKVKRLGILITILFVSIIFPKAIYAIEEDHTIKEEYALETENEYVTESKHETEEQPLDTNIPIYVRSPRAIVGTDERKHITNTTTSPYSAIGLILATFPNGNQYSGTGWLYGRNVVATAAHLAYREEDGGYATEIMFYPGYNEGIQPFGAAKVIEQRVPDEWVKGSKGVSNDYAALVLDSNIGDKAGWLELKVDTTQYSSSSQVIVTGYPGEQRPRYQLWEGIGLINTEWLEYLPNIIYHFADSTPGQSGSPIFNENRDVIGISNTALIGETSEENENAGVRISDSVVQFLQINNIEAKIKLKNISIKEGHQATSDFYVSQTNNDTEIFTSPQEVNWSSSNTAIATIDSNGIIKGIKSGFVTITGTLKSDLTIFATAEITISPLTLTEAFVARCYTNILGRTFDENGLAYWNNLLTTGKSTAADIAQSFLLSPEFTAKNSSAETYVTILYRVFLGREPDKGGFSYWVNYLNHGVSRRGILARFIASPEFTAICKQYGIIKGNMQLLEQRDRNMDVTAYLSRCYTQVLSRKADASGLNYWSELILNGKMTANQVAQAFLRSPEFQGKRTTNQEYIVTLYRTYMGREVDNDGMRYWVNQLNQGLSRQIVAERFGTSPEFKALLKSYGL